MLAYAGLLIALRRAWLVHLIALVRARGALAGWP
jgi:hypothetical protein